MNIPMPEEPVEWIKNNNKKAESLLNIKGILSYSLAKSMTQYVFKYPLSIL